MIQKDEQYSDFPASLGFDRESWLRFLRFKLSATRGKLSGLTVELSSISVFNSLAAGSIWVPVFSAFP